MVSNLLPLLTTKRRQSFPQARIRRNPVGARHRNRKRRRAGEGLNLIECKPDVVRYDGNRCVLRYEVLWRLGATDRKLKQVVYGKVYTDDRGASVGPALEAVRPNVQTGAGGARTFLVPRLRGYLAASRLVLLDAIPGIPVMPQLIREWAHGPDGSGAPADALASCAQIAASLHGIGSGPGPARTLQTEYDAALAEIAAVAPLAPVLAEALLLGLADVHGVLGDKPLPPGFGHGDLRPSQFLFDGPLRGMVDFDSVCRAEPALDLGQFTAHLSVTARKAQGAADYEDSAAITHLGNAFLDAYVEAADIDDGRALAARAAAYRQVSLARAAVMGWRQLKPARVRVAQQLLEADEAAVGAATGPVPARI